MQRKFLKQIKRIVVKVGSSTIASYQLNLREENLDALVKQICTLEKSGIEVVLVSSGAIVLGMGALNEKNQPTDLASLQATAAIGQTVLMRTYDEIFKKHKGLCAQVLLTWDDFNDRKRFLNARNTLQAILARKVIPVVNENDTIATDEIKFGDNDKLSALVASVVEADLLIILSDVEGLYDLRGEEKKLFEEVREITEEIESLARASNKKHMGRGGMAAKLDAVKIAAQAKIPTVITNGAIEDVLLKILKGDRIGTLFIERQEKLLARQHWISFGAKPKGVLVVDDGAAKALLDGNKSLLLPGIVSFTGNFKKGEIVAVADMHNQEIARGLIEYSLTELQNLEDKKGKKEAIHKDNLVLCKR